jgi:hypothetical protein
MQRFFANLLDNLTYRDLGGRRKVRTFSLAAGLILCLLLGLAGLSAIQRTRMLHQVQATPAPLPSATGTAPATPVPIHTETAPDCPQDPAEWSLGDVAIRQNYKTIQPACVYDGLSRTVAWALAVRQGYTRRAATELLGFSEMPMRPLKEVTTLSDTQGPRTIPVSFISPHPDFAEWYVDGYGKPAVHYSLRGCFRTTTVVGNRLETWGGDYPVMCVVAEDAEISFIVYALEGHGFTARAKARRAFLLFGYAGRGLWVWLGTQADPQTPIDDSRQFANDRDVTAALYDSLPWDQRWFRGVLGLSKQPLPAGWEGLTDEAEMQAILSLLNEQVEGAGQ